MADILKLKDPIISSAAKLEKTVKINAKKKYCWFYKAYKVTVVRARDNELETKDWTMPYWWTLQRAKKGIEDSVVQDILDFIDED
jgi:hypothetical protein